MKKTINSLMDEILNISNRLEIKLAQDESDEEDLKNTFELCQEGKLDWETYEDLKRMYNKLRWERWAK